LSPAETDPDRPIILVSDWHLPPEHTAQAEFFVRFCQEVCQGARQVFVLGDLFQAWVGPKHAARPGHARVLETLERLAGSGTTVVLLRGNRDFLLDRKVTRRYGLELAGDAWCGELSGKRYRLSHGDEVCEDDRLHKFLRAVTGHPPLSTLAKLAPLSAGDAVARFYRRLSDRRRTRRKTRKLEPSADRLRAEFDAGPDVIVIGHWHEPRLQTDAFGLAGKTFVMLGECTEVQASYAEILGEAIRLKTFPGQ